MARLDRLYLGHSCVIFGLVIEFITYHLVKESVRQWVQRYLEDIIS